MHNFCLLSTYIVVQNCETIFLEQKLVDVTLYVMWVKKSYAVSIAAILKAVILGLSYNF